MVETKEMSAVSWELLYTLFTMYSFRLPPENNLLTNKRMKKNHTFLFSFLISSFYLLSGCGGKSSAPGNIGGVQLSNSNRVVEHVLNELERLNPQNSTGEDETYVEE